MFLSEPWLFQADLPRATELLSSQYKMFLNSDDLYDPQLPLLQNRAHGGTLTMWKAELDHLVTILPSETSRITTLVLDPPDTLTTVHINIYLPTSGKDPQYINTLATLQATIDEVSSQYPEAPIYIKGDANASFIPRKDNKRDPIFRNFVQNNSLHPLELSGHKTYHHFMGGGASDSNIDVALSPNTSPDDTNAFSNETLLKILCCKDDPKTSNSHHDAILTNIALSVAESIHHFSPIDETPTIENNRHRINWSPDQLQSYRDLLHPVLSNLQESLENFSSSSSNISLLLQQTNTVLDSAALATQHVVHLNKTNKPRKLPIPPELKLASSNHQLNHDNLKTLLKNPSSSISEIETAKNQYTLSRAGLQTAKRIYKAGKEADDAQKLQTILSSNPSSLFRAIKSTKSSKVSINKLKVDDELFLGTDVGKGFFQSISKLKTLDDEPSSCPTFQAFLADHKNIMEICKHGKPIPPLDFSTAHDLLKSIKPLVTDLYNISAAHYLNGGDPAITHFQLLLNAVLANVESYALDEMNSCHAIVLHKGHGKDKYSDRSYRTISSCPFIAKAADKYIGGLEEDSWSSAQAETQFQGKGLSHEHAALLLTESINLTISLTKLPVFALYLDARSAFDRALREILSRRMFLDGTSGHSLLYLEERLKNRKTFVEWDKTIMGPILDQQGVEQGGPNSSDQYKLYQQQAVLQYPGLQPWSQHWSFLDLLHWPGR